MKSNKLQLISLWVEPFTQGFVMELVTGYLSQLSIFDPGSYGWQDGITWHNHSFCPSLVVKNNAQKAILLVIFVDM